MHCINFIPVSVIIRTHQSMLFSQTNIGIILTCASDFVKPMKDIYRIVVIARQYAVNRVVREPRKPRRELVKPEKVCWRMSQSVGEPTVLTKVLPR
jgi:hypothetical protein